MADINKVIRVAVNSSETGSSGFTKTKTGLIGIASSAKSAATSLAGLGVALSAGSAVLFLANAVRSAGEAEAAQAKLAHVMRNTSGASEEQIKAVSDLAEETERLTGADGDQIKVAAAKLAAFKLNSGQIQALIPGLVDLAENSKRFGDEEASLEKLAVALGKSLDSGTNSLARYGVSLSDAEKEAFKAASSLDRVKILAAALDGSVGGLAETMGNTFPGALQKTDRAMDTFNEATGELITQTPSAKEAVTSLKDAFIDAAGGIRDSAGEITPVVSVLSATLITLASDVKSVWNLVQISVKGMILGILEAKKSYYDFMAGVSFGALSQKYANAAELAKQQSAALKASMAGDAADIAKAGRQMERAWDFEGQAADAKKLADATKNLKGGAIDAADAADQQADADKKSGAETKKKTQTIREEIDAIESLKRARQDAITAQIAADQASGAKAGTYGPLLSDLEAAALAEARVRQAKAELDEALKKASDPKSVSMRDMDLTGKPLQKEAPQIPGTARIEVVPEISEQGLAGLEGSIPPVTVEVFTLYKEGDDAGRAAAEAPITAEFTPHPNLAEYEAARARMEAPTSSTHTIYVQQVNAEAEKVEGKASGGLIRGPGTDTSDNILARLSPGEYVVKAAAVRHYGPELLARLNAISLPRFANGGMVRAPAPATATAGGNNVYLTLDGKQIGPMLANNDVASSLQRLARMRGSVR